MKAYPQDGDDSLLRQDPRASKRRKILVRGLRYHHFRQQIAYSQARPTQLRLPRETTRLDCSGLVAACMDFAGVLPQIDWRYTNTWSQIKHGRPVTIETAKPGDVVFYGSSTGNPTHEALYLGRLGELRQLVDDVPADIAAAMKGGARMVLSNGHYPMDVYPVDYRDDRVTVRAFV